MTLLISFLKEQKKRRETLVSASSLKQRTVLQ